MALAYLLDPCLQHQNRAGVNNVSGYFEVFEYDTDDRATVYTDFDGTLAPEHIGIDNNGRCVMIVDSAKAYRVEMHLPNGGLIYAQSPVWTVVSGGGSLLGSTYNVVSSDGSISVDTSEGAGVTTFDIGIAPNDSDEFLEWIKCSEEDCGSTWKPFYQEGTMETDGDGVKVHGGHLYHFTSTFYVDPNGTGINYDTFTVTMYCNDEIVDVRDFDIDSSLNDAVQCEFSTDVIPSEDGHVYYTLNIPITCEVTGELQCHRIYSGINAVPDTCATKQWVQETFDYNMSEKISYSALEYNVDNEITGISGSALAGGMDSATVSAIASSYAESAASGKLDQSSSGMFAPSGDYYSATNPSGFITTADLTDFAKESALSSKLDASASSMFAPSGDYVFESAYSAYTSDVANEISSISSVVSGITGDWSGKADQSAVDLKLDASASSQFYLTSNPSGFITGVDLSPYQRTADMSAYQVSGDYAYNSSLSAKLDASASSDFYSTSNPSGFLTGVDLDPYVPFSSIKGTAGEITGIGGSAISVPDTFTGVHTDSSLTGNGLSSAPLGVERVDVVFDSSMTTAMSGDSIVIGVNESALDLTAYQYASAMTAYQTTAGMSGYIPTSESANYYSTANPSGFLTGVDLTPYQLTADMSGYQVSGDYAYNSAVSAKLDASASSEFQPSGDYYSATNPSGFVGSAYVDSSVSGKLDASASADFMLTSERADYLPASASADLFTGVETDSSLTGNGLSSAPLGVERVDVQFVSGLATGMSGDMIVVSADNDYYSGYATTAYVDSSVSGKLDASASSDFYGTANPSGFIDGASASAIASAYQVVSATATQLNAGTAYLTSVNETPISAARAGNAANATLATSAWYDGTGRMISALPDEATVSSIASAYAESAASSKLDESATADFYSTSNPSGFITGVDLSDYATTAYVDSSVSGKLDTTAYNSSEFYSTSNPSGFITGVDLSDYATTAYVDSSVSSKLDTTAFNSGDFYTTSNPSGFIDSAYVDSAVSGKADSSALSSYVPYSSLEYNTASAISGINGSALAAGSTYSAGEGIDITDDVISVEAPVDIVAGPGIAIDNPDGNTVRVSANTDSFFKELYYNATNTNDTAGKVYALSEPITNFMYAKITVDNMEFANRPLVYEIDVQHNTTTCVWNSPLDNGSVANNINLPVCQLQINASGNLVLVARGLTYNTYPLPNFTNGDSRGMRVVRVVGIFRIAGGN